MPFVQGSSSSDDTVPLLKDSPPTYYRSVDDDDVVEPSSPIEDPPLLNNFSNVDVAWILAGLWSAVFLGALGSFLIIIPRPQTVTDLMPSIIITLDGEQTRD
jgi:hypothetical protein